MVVAFLPFATSVLAGALRSGHGEGTAVVFYAIAFDMTALTFNAVWQYACRHRLLSQALESAGATAISRRFQLALVWLATSALLGAVPPVLGLAVIAAFNAFYWLPIRGESPRPRPLRRPWLLADIPCPARTQPHDRSSSPRASARQGRGRGLHRRRRDLLSSRPPYSAPLASSPARRGNQDCRDVPPRRTKSAPLERAQERPPHRPRVLLESNSGGTT
jgi:hypothetical protein